MRHEDRSQVEALLLEHVRHFSVDLEPGVHDESVGSVIQDRARGTQIGGQHEIEGSAQISHAYYRAAFPMPRHRIPFAVLSAIQF